MTLEFNFDSLRVFQVVNNDLTTLLRAHTNRMTVCAEADCREWRADFNFLHLLALDDIKEVDTAVEASTAK